MGSVLVQQLNRLSYEGGLLGIYNIVWSMPYMPMYTANPFYHKQKQQQQQSILA